MVVKHKSSDDASVHEVTCECRQETRGSQFFLTEGVQKHFIDGNRTELSNTLFSLPYPGCDLSRVEIVRKADVINLHWVADFQSVVTLSRLFLLKKPVVWTLHDMWAFTGGCHYSAGCENYTAGCASCPQLSEDPFGLPGAVLKDKLALFRKAKMTIVTPGRWMADCAAKSRLFGDRPVHVIPNSVETDIFAPLPKQDAKRSLKIPADATTILFAVEDGKERRKGFAHLIEAFHRCMQDRRFRDLAEQGKVRLMSLGDPGPIGGAGHLPILPLGYLHSDEDIRTAYCAADMLALPSMEDNFPNTMLEAMSCATPVVGFATGGIPDIVVSGGNGLLAPAGDSAGLGDALLSLVFDPGRREEMGRKCRRLIEDGFSPSDQARKYAAVYEDLHARQPGRSTSRRKWVPETVKKLSADMETGLGPRFSAIYERVLLPSLKALSGDLQLRFEKSEADRTAMVSQVEELTRLLKESEADREARLTQAREASGLLAEKEAQNQTLHAQVQDLIRWLKESETDRDFRGRQVADLTGWLRESEADREARGRQIEELTRQLRESEADREARGTQVLSLTGLLRESESDREARGRQIEELTRRLLESEADREARGRQVEELTGWLKESEADRGARGEQVAMLSERLEESEADREALRGRIDELTPQLRASEADREARGRQIAELTQRLLESEADRGARGIQTLELARMLNESEADREARGRQVEDLTGWLHTSETDREALGRQMAEVTRRLEECENDRAARGTQIQELTGWLQESEADREQRGKQIDELTCMLKESEADREARGRQITDLTGWLRESEADRGQRGKQIDELTRMLKESEADRQARGRQIEELTMLLKHSESGE